MIYHTLEHRIHSKLCLTEKPLLSSYRKGKKRVPSISKTYKLIYEPMFVSIEINNNRAEIKPISETF